MTCYYVMVKVYGEPNYIANGLTFESEEKAGEYARDLALRWTAVEDWVVMGEEQDDKHMHPMRAR